MATGRRNSDSLGEETISYQIRDETGTTDVDFVIVDVTCFVRGTLIETPGGAVVIENLRPGDPVLTRSRGAAPAVGRLVPSRCGNAGERTLAAADPHQGALHKMRSRCLALPVRSRRVLVRSARPMQE